MRAQARRYARVKKASTGLCNYLLIITHMPPHTQKAATRASHLKSIPVLQGPEWEYLSHTGYMSQDESDSEGGLVTLRHEYRAKWVSLGFCNNALLTPVPGEQLV
jgi:hypothetical protein